MSNSVIKAHANGHSNGVGVAAIKAAKPTLPNVLTDAEKVELITEKFADIMEILGLDLTDDSLKDTPARVAKMYVHETFQGLNPLNKPEVTLFENGY
ncbi:MAG: GTP cyclohydrolase I FolE, partial [Flavobacteriia bacterium]|nr:GTP cyclohydrolase I FolE [Flavobacteriia bacterium]